MRKYICEGLATYLAKDHKPWHMPGHKRKNFIEDIHEEADIDMAAFSGEANEIDDWSLSIDTILGLNASIDVTEVPGTDDLHHPEEMILKSQQQLSEIYGTYASYYMVNGSTGGILSAIGAVADCGAGGKKSHIIMARNCHKSVYNAVKLFGLEPIYMEPEYVNLGYDEVGCEDKTYQTNYNSYIYGAIKPQQVRELVEANQDVVAVVITSPTYEGVLSDVEGIMKVLKPYNIPLVVDEAHGAHLPFVKELPDSAVKLGADIVVQSLHKTLPSLTQTALLHVNNEGLDKAVRKYLSIFMSSSPSYIMLCSMEQAVVGAWERKNRQQGYREYIINLKDFRDSLKTLKNIKLLGEAEELDLATDFQDGESFFAYDITRIVLYSEESGETLATMLRDIGNIEVEMSGTNYVVLISTYMDSAMDLEHLENVIKLADEELNHRVSKNNPVGDKHLEQDLLSKEQLDKLVGTVAIENIYVYPPGSYIVAAGEIISQVAVDKIIKLRDSGKRIVGLKGE